MAWLVLLVLCSGCTAFTPPINNGSEVWNSDCETIDCLLEKYDEIITNIPTSTGRRWDWMEGYKDTPLVKLKEMGLLTIEEINPWWLVPQIATGTFLLGYASVKSGTNGDIRTCEVHYLPIPGWKYILTHELMHCQGYMEGGYGLGALIVNLQDGYTTNQKTIMKKENVDKWLDTSVYKNEDDTWHDR
jgi:hypothetical protein